MTKPNALKLPLEIEHGYIWTYFVVVPVLIFLVYISVQIYAIYFVLHLDLNNLNEYQAQILQRQFGWNYIKAAREFIDDWKGLFAVNLTIGSGVLLAITTILHSSFKPTNLILKNDGIVVTKRGILNGKDVFSAQRYRREEFKRVLVTSLPGAPVYLLGTNNRPTIKVGVPRGVTANDFAIWLAAQYQLQVDYGSLTPDVN